MSLGTGSSDTIFDASNSPLCLTQGGCVGGTFDSNASSTYSVVQKDGFNFTYGDGSATGGDYGTDVFQIGDISISGLEFGVTTFLTSTTGPSVSLLGLGYSLNEVAAVE